MVIGGFQITKLHIKSPLYSKGLAPKFIYQTPTNRLLVIGYQFLALFDSDTIISQCEVPGVIIGLVHYNVDNYQYYRPVTCNLQVIKFPKAPLQSFGSERERPDDLGDL